MSFAEEIRGLTFDSGARRCGEVLDELAATLDALKQQVNNCCASDRAEPMARRLDALQVQVDALRESNPAPSATPASETTLASGTSPPPSTE